MPKRKKATTILAARTELQKRLKAMRVERDRLKALRDEIDDIDGQWDEACFDIETAIEALSKYV